METNDKSKTIPYNASPERYTHMHYRRCGTNFGFVDARHAARTTLRTAFDHGIVHWDLANNYGPPYGSAEQNLGTLLRADFTAHRDELVISTKAGFDMWPGPYGRGGRIPGRHPRPIWTRTRYAASMASSSS